MNEEQAYLKMISEAPNGKKVYNNLINNAKTLAYAFEDYPDLSSLYKKADALLGAIENKEKQIIKAIEGK